MAITDLTQGVLYRTIYPQIGHVLHFKAPVGLLEEKGDYQVTVIKSLKEEILRGLEPKVFQKVIFVETDLTTLSNFKHSNALTGKLLDI
jgi:hypothetical protein